MNKTSYYLIVSIAIIIAILIIINTNQSWISFLVIILSAGFGNALKKHYKKSNEEATKEN